MTPNMVNNLPARKTIVIGHYGSGKTEFSVSLAMHLSSLGHPNLAIVDLDIINPYFRSRERRKLLTAAEIGIYGSAYDTEITAELPALGSSIRAPLEDSGCNVIIDSGGNSAGAVVLNQFTRYFTDDETEMVAVINNNRPETDTAEKAIAHITAIEDITQIKVSKIVNNSHLLFETSTDTIASGHIFCKKICAHMGVELFCDCYPVGLIDPENLIGICEKILPMGLYMRPFWP